MDKKLSPINRDNNSVIKILTRREYLGDLVNFKTHRLSYKSNIRELIPVENQLVFENKHPATIDRDTWYAVQKRWNQRTRPTHSNVPDLFSNLLYCADCGKKLYTCQGKDVKNKAYVCASHHKDRSACTRHRILTADLEDSP